MKKNLKCKIGFHNFFLDSALLSYASRCADCGIWQDKKQGKRVEKERSIIEAHRGLPEPEIKVIVIDHFYGREKK